jgi:uncharacterized protein YggE
MDQQTPSINFSFWPKWSDNKLFSLLLSFLIIYTLVWLLGQIRNDIKKYEFIGRGEARNVITIEGEGKVTATPDIATVDIGMFTEGKEITKIQIENSQKMNDLITKIKGLGIEAKDIQTTDYSINPQYDWPDGKRVFRGYRVNQSVHVKIRDLNKIGDVLKLAGESGANEVSGVNFTIDDPEALKAQAREKALENAFNKILAIAQKTGVRLGKIMSYSEYVPGEPEPYYRSMPEAGVGGGESTNPRIESGSLEIKVNVVIGWEVF